MTESHDFSGFFQDVRAGDEAACRKLWEMYFHRMKGLAHRRMEQSGLPRRSKGSEDVAMSAFCAFFVAVRENRYPDLNDEVGVWNMLAQFTKRKLNDWIDYDTAQKRDVNRTRGGSYFARPSEAPNGPQLERHLQDTGHSPQFQLEIEECFEKTIQSIRDDRIVAAVALSVEGYTVSDIAKQLDEKPPNVRRWLRRFRDTFQVCLDADDQ